MRSMVPQEYGYHIGLNDRDDLGSLGLDVEEDDLGNVEDIPKQQRLGSGPRPNDGKTRLISLEDGHIQLSVNGKTTTTTIEVLGYLRKINPDTYLLRKYLTTEGSQQPPAGATNIFNQEMSIRLGVEPAEEGTLVLHHQTGDNDTCWAMYGSENSLIECIIKEVDDIEHGLREYGIHINQRRGAINIGDLTLSPGEIKDILKVAEAYQLWEDSSPAYSSNGQVESRPSYVDELGKGVLNPEMQKDYWVSEVLEHPNGFGVEAIKIVSGDRRQSPNYISL